MKKIHIVGLVPFYEMVDEYVKIQVRFYKVFDSGATQLSYYYAQLQSLCLACRIVIFF